MENLHSAAALLLRATEVLIQSFASINSLKLNSHKAFQLVLH